MERKYMMYEGEEVNSIDLLSETPTTEGNGVKIIVPVKYSDKHDFIEKIKEQLAYFENVYFDVKDVDNTFNIYRSEHYQISDVSQNSSMHICLDNVYYPLDFSKLGIPELYYCNVGLRFNLTDGLFPTPNRESIRYTQEAKQIILNKIKVLANEFMTKYNDSIADTDDIRTVIDHYQSSYKYIKNHNGDLWNVSEILKHATILMRTPTLMRYKHFTANDIYKLKDYLLKEYTCKYNVSKYNARMSEARGQWDTEINISKIAQEDKIGIFSGTLSDRKRRYIKELWKKQSAKIIKKSNPYTLFSKNDNWTINSINSGSTDMRCYYDLLKLYNHPKSEWREIIVEFQKTVNSLTNTFVDLDAIKIPDAWIVADKAKNYKPKPILGKTGLVKEKGDVNGKKAVQPERETGFNAKFVSIVYDGKTLSQRKKLTVYAKEEDRLSLDHLFGMFQKLQNEIEFVIMSDREIKHLEIYNVHNFMSLATFLKGNNKPFKRMMTAKLIFIFKRLYNNVFETRNVLDVVNSELTKNLEEMYDYQKKMVNTSAKETNTTLKLEEYACEHNLYNLEMFTKLNRTDKLLSKHSFIKKLCDKMANSYSYVKQYEGLLDVMKDMCRYKKMRMNLNNYNLVQKQEVDVLEEAA